jgi:large conductance mechanosensitive channel
MTVRRSRAATGSFLKDFQEFALKGSVVDLAVAVIIGGAFGKIITSFVEDIITPALLSPALKAAQVNDLQSLAVNGIKYGAFLAAVLNFIVIAFCMFLIIRSFEQAKRGMSRQDAIAAEETLPDPAVVSQERLTNALDRLTQTLETTQGR